MDYRQVMEVLLDRSNNSFEPLSFLADQSNNDNLYYRQAMKAHNSEDFKKVIKKKINDSHKENIFDIILLDDKSKD